MEYTLLPEIKSAKVAGLIALTRVYQLEKNKKANIYIDSGYISGVVHDFGMLQKQGDFLTLTGTP